MHIFFIAFVLTILFVTLTFSWLAVFLAITMCGIACAIYTLFYCTQKGIHTLLYEYLLILIGAAVAVLAILIHTQRTTIGEDEGIAAVKSSYSLLVLQHIRADRYRTQILPGQQEVFLSSPVLLHPGEHILVSCIPQPAYTPSFDRRLSLLGIQEQIQYFRDSTIRFQRWLFLRGVMGYCKTFEVQRVGESQLPWLDHIRYTIQKKTETKVTDIEYRSLLLGTLVGDSSLFSKEEYERFVSTGLVHLLVVSGGNIALLLGVLNILLFRVPLRIRRAIFLIAIPLYALLCGGDSSVLRASVMGILTVLALLQGRQVSIWRLLVYAAIVLLLRNPYFLLYDIGFLLSFGAVAGIVLRGHLQKSSVFVIRACSALRGASYGTLPLLLLVSDGRNLLSLPANFLASFCYTLLYATIAFHGISLVIGSWLADICMFFGSIIAESVYITAYYADKRKITLGAELLIGKYVLALLRYIWGYMIYKKNSSRTHGFEPSPSASETDMLPMTPRP